MITWLRETDGLEFIEAVRQLSDMAGLPMPADDRNLVKLHNSAKPRLTPVRPPPPSTALLLPVLTGRRPAGILPPAACLIR